MERIDAAALQARASRNGPSGVELFRQLLGSYAIEQVPGESLAETVARAAGINRRKRSSPSRVRIAAPNNGAPLTAPGRSAESPPIKREKLTTETVPLAPPFWYR
jgi:hypothetical protein